MIFNRTVTLLERELEARYKVSTTIRHKGEKGRQREQGLGMLLREILPEAYGVASGEIIPYAGIDPSPQCDLIIYDRLYFPILGKSSTVQQVPFEAVLAVIECKSVIDSKALADTTGKIQAIRRLPRVPTRVRRGRVRGPMFVLFGYTCAASERQCKRFVKHADTRRSSVLLTVLGEGNYIKLSDRPDPVFVRSETLALMLTVFLYSLREIDLGNPDYLKLLWYQR